MRPGIFSRSSRAVAAAAVAAALLSPVVRAQGTGPAAGSTIQLTMEQAVAMALATSLDLRSERLNVDIASQDIAIARASFLPVVTSSLNQVKQSSPTVRNNDGTITVPSSVSLDGSAAITQTLPWHGSSVRALWNGGRSETIGSPGGSFNPALESSFQVSFAQPLLRGFSIDQNRAALDRTERQHVIADLVLDARVVATEASVRVAYLALIAAIEGQKVARQNMDLAEQSLQNTRARVAVGQSPQIDIVTFEASVESNREQLIVADAQIATSEDRLRSEILDPNRPDYWTVHLEPTDAVVLAPRNVDIDAAVRNALANRLDLTSFKREMEITDLNLALSRDLTKPDVNVGLTYAGKGNGGTHVVDGVPDIRGFGTVLGDTFGNAYPTWVVGVSVGYPLGRSAAEASLAQNQVRQQQEVLKRKTLELQIVSAVREAGRDVQTTYQRVQATQAALSASERQLEAEERKFAVGLSDTFQLQTRQKDLGAARVSQLNAVIAYNRALIEFDRIQKVP